MKKIVVLGAGLVGKAIAADLSKAFDVTVSDVNVIALSQLKSECKVKTLPCDFKNSPALTKILKPFDLVVAAVPGFLGFNVLKTIIEAGKNVVDISFFPEDPFELDRLAKKKKVTAIVDCGVAPGMCNILLGYHSQLMKITRYECLVGGLPVKREWPFEYKAVFSPIDVIEEYVRPARYVENGKEIVKEALTDIEEITFPQIGKLEAFNTDGLRSIAQTHAYIPNMKEKTMRYPGHAALMKIFRETGFFDKKKIDVKGVSISPLDLTSRLFFQKWKMNKGEEDFTIMRVVIDGIEKRQPASYVYTLLDKFDKKSNTTSMARTTGYTCTAVANLLADKKFSRKGICPPEFVGEDAACFNYIVSYLEKRGVFYEKQVYSRYSI